MMIFDLSQTLKSSMCVFPGDPDTKIERIRSIPDSTCNLTTANLCLHAGTHVDAMFHFLSDGETVDKLPLKYYVGKAIILRIVPENGKITVKKLLSELDSITCSADESILLIDSGWETKAGTQEYFTEMPVFDSELGCELKKRGFISLGLDMPSISLNGNNTSAHIDLFKNGIALIESIVGLGAIPHNRVFFSAAPLKIADAEGAPTRAYAIDPEA